MVSPTEIRYTEYYRIENEYNGYNSEPPSSIEYCRITTANGSVETLVINLLDYSDSLRGRYRLTRNNNADKTDKGKISIIEYINVCNPRGCKADTQAITSLPEDISYFLKDFPDTIREIAGVL